MHDQHSTHKDYNDRGHIQVRIVALVLTSDNSFFNKINGHFIFEQAQQSNQGIFPEGQQ